MKYKKIIILSALFVGILVLAIFAKGESNSNLNSSDVVFDDLAYIDTTSNLFTIIGSKVSGLLAKVIGYVFMIINKIFEFVFGI